MAQPFDWTGVCLPHYIVTNPVSKNDLTGFWCVMSRCGISGILHATALAGEGGPQRCPRCRSKLAQSAISGSLGRKINNTVLNKNDLPKDHPWLQEMHKLYREGKVIKTDISNLGKDALAAWDAHGANLMKRLIEGTGLGATFGWHVKIVDVCKARPGKPVQLRLRNTNPAEKRIDLMVRPIESNWEFNVTLRTGRTTVFSHILDKIQASMNAINDALVLKEAESKVEEKPLVIAAAPAPSAPATPEVVALETMRKNIDMLIESTKRSGEVSQRVQQARQEVEKALDKAGPLLRVLDEIRGKHDEEKKALQARSELVASLRMKLKNAEVLEKDSEESVRLLSERLQEAEKSAAGPAKDLDAAKELLAEAERAEEETSKLAGITAEYAAFLKALGSISR